MDDSTAPRGARRLELCATRALTFKQGTVWDDGRSLFVLDGTTLRTYDVRTLEPRWSAAAKGTEPGAVWGPYVAHVGSNSATLVVRDRVDGAQVALIAFPPRALLDGILSARTHLVAVWARQDDDRPDELFVVDLPDGAPAGARVREWAPGSGTGKLITTRDLLLQEWPRPSTSARDLGSAELRWEQEGRPLCADAREAFLLADPHGAPRIVCVDAATGRPRWTHGVAAKSALSHALGPELLVVATTALERKDRRSVSVDALDRDTGAARWSMLEVGASVAVAVAQGVVYVAYGGDDELTVSCLDARSGVRVATCLVELRAQSAAGRPWVGLSPVDGAVVVTIRGHDGTWLGRVGEP